MRRSAAAARGGRSCGRTPVCQILTPHWRFENENEKEVHPCRFGIHVPGFGADAGADLRMMRLGDSMQNEGEE